MSTNHVVLGLLAGGDRHGYDLKHEYDARFPASRPLAFGQVYATLERLQKKGWAQATSVARVDGPDRKVFTLTEDGRTALNKWLAEIDDPAPFVNNPLALKATIALLAADETTATDYLRNQRAAHLERMRHYTRLKTDSTASTAALLAADYAIAHLDADLRWLETALQRVAALANNSVPNSAITNSAANEGKQRDENNVTGQPGNE